MAIKRVSMNTSNMTVGWLTTYRDELITDQPYQRGLVWGTERKVNLIFSLLSGVPIPSMIINDRWEARFDNGSDHGFSVIDGKQRINTLLGFIDSDFAVPADWFEDQYIADPDLIGKEVLYRDLTKSFQTHFRNGLTIGIAMGQFPTEADEENIFNLVNFGGVAQGDTDL